MEYITQSNNKYKMSQYHESMDSYHNVDPLYIFSDNSDHVNQLYQEKLKYYCKPEQSLKYDLIIEPIFDFDKNDFNDDSERKLYEYKKYIAKSKQFDSNKNTPYFGTNLLADTYSSYNDDVYNVQYIDKNIQVVEINSLLNLIKNKYMPTPLSFSNNLSDYKHTSPEQPYYVSPSILNYITCLKEDHFKNPNNYYNIYNGCINNNTSYDKTILECNNGYDNYAYLNK